MVGAELEPGVLSAGSSSFIVVDFFDFESQATPLLPGVSPAFDFATTFKVCCMDEGSEIKHTKHAVSPAVSGTGILEHGLLRPVVPPGSFLSRANLKEREPLQSPVRCRNCVCGRL